MTKHHPRHVHSPMLRNTLLGLAASTFLACMVLLLMLGLGHQ